MGRVRRKGDHCLQVCSVRFSCHQPRVKDTTVNVHCGGFLRMHCCGQHLLSPYPPRTFELKHDRLAGAHGSTLMPLF